MLRPETNPIEVTVRSARKAYDIIKDMNVSFRQESSNVFLVPDSDEWNDVMEMFEEQNIELL